MEKKLSKIDLNIIYMVLINIYLVSTIFSTGFVYSSDIPRMPLTAIRIIVMIMCFFKIFLIDLKKYSYKSIVGMTIVLLILLLASLFSKDLLLLQLFALTLATFNLDMNRILKSILIVLTSTITIIVALSLLNVIPNLTFTRRGSTIIRNSFGFNYCTFLSIYGFFLSITYIYLRNEKMKLVEYIPLFIINLAIFYFTDTRNGFICFIAVLIFGLLIRNKAIKPILKWICKYGIFIICILSLISIITYNSDNKVYSFINEKTSNRLYLGHNAYEKYGVSLFGQKLDETNLVDMHYNNVVNEKTILVDNSFLYIMLKYGAIVLVITLFVYFKFANYAVTENDDYLIIILLSLYINFFFDHYIILLRYNYLLLLIPLFMIKRNKYSDFEGSKEYVDVKLIQNESKKMLKTITDFLDENNLEYYICGGTLLGAIRHKGFIPWDDDIDILMPRYSFEKLKEISVNNKYINENMYIKSLDNKLNEFPFIKICDDRFIVEEERASDFRRNNLWIDVFPMDGLPDSKEKINKIFKKSLFYRKILAFRVYDGDYVVNQRKFFLLKIIKAYIKTFVDMIPVRKISKWIDNLSKKYDFKSSNYVGGIMWGYGPQEALHLKDVQKRVKVQFEDMNVYTFSCWDEYLSNLYGDYMQLPPVDKQISHIIKFEKNK